MDAFAQLPSRLASLPSPWEAVVRRCLEPAPEDRFRSVEEVMEQLLPSMTRRKWIAVPAAIAVALAALLLTLKGPAPRPLDRASIDSIAVIPLSAGSEAPEKQYLADGVGEGLIDALARLPDLKVIARTSSYQFRGEKIDVLRAARMLGVRGLVLFRITESEERIRITVELVDGQDGTRIWGSRYSPRQFELAGAQADISREIAERVRSELTLADQMRLARGGKVNAEAFALLLRGRYELKLYTPESRRKAVSYFEQALAVDPGFALANAELAAAYRLLSASAILNAAEMLPKAEAAAQRALAADEDLAEAHVALANIKRDQWDWQAAERGYQRAVQLNPNLAAAHQGFAICLSVTSRHQAAIREAQRARELDPIALPAFIDTAAVYYNGRRFDEALDTLRQAANMDPSAPAPWTWMGIVNGGRGRPAEAAKAYEKAVSLGDRTAATQAYYVYSLAQSGRRRQALEILDRVLQSTEFVPAPSLAIAYAGLGHPERALQLLESSYAARDPLLQYVNVEAHFDSIRNDRRFLKLTAGIGFPKPVKHPL